MSPTELFHDIARRKLYPPAWKLKVGWKICPWRSLKTIPNVGDISTWIVTLLAQMQEAFKELIATQEGFNREMAEKLGLWNEREAAEQGIVNPETVEIPCWRHAVISFPHPLTERRPDHTRYAGIKCP